MVDVANDPTTTAYLDLSWVSGLTAGGTYSGLIETAGDIDFIRVSLSAGVTYRFYGSAQTTGTSPTSRIDSVMRLYFLDGETHAAFSDDDGAGSNSYIEYTPYSNSDYFIEMKSYDNILPDQVGAYSVWVTKFTGPPPTVNEQLDATSQTYTTAVANAFVMAGAGDDIVNLGATTGSIGVGAVGEQGNDALNGNALANRLAGGLGNDTLFGFDGADVLWGDAGDDELNGGTGIDEVHGGDGNDTITDTEGLGASDDDIYDGGDGVDTLVHDLNWGSNVHFNLATGLVTYNGNRDQLFSIENLTVGGSAQVTGDSNDNVLKVNGSEDNIIAGGGGGDTITGGGGTDTMTGDDGDDVFLIAAPGDNRAAEIINGGADTDRIRFTSTTANETLTLRNLVTLVEIVEITDAAGVAIGTTALNLDASALTAGIELRGNDGVNTITGTELGDSIDGGGGADILNGGGGGDTLTGGAGVDSLYGGAGNDLITYVAGQGYDNYNGGADVDTVVFQSVFGDALQVDLGVGHYNAGGPVFDIVDVENIVTGNGNDTLTGNNEDNGLDGGGGSDTLIGGNGNDTYVINRLVDGLTTDTVQETGTVASTADLVQFTASIAGQSYTLGNTVENLTVLGTLGTNGVGNLLANTITGNAGNNTLDGRAGLDTLIGGNGNDTYIINRLVDGLTTDTVQETGTVASTADLVQFTAGIAGQSYTLGNTVENLTVLGTLGANGVGNLLANTITGNAGNNTLDGRAGLDTLIGGNGNDTYIINRLVDGLTTDAVQETGTVASTADLVQFTAGIAGQSYTLGNTVENLTVLGTLGANGVGNTLANVFTGNIGVNNFNGGDGNDTYNLQNMTDTVTEANGAAGGGTADTVVFTGAATNTYTLGATFVERLTLGGTATINGTANTLANIITGNTAGNILNGMTGKDVLIGGGGADHFRFTTPLNATTNVDTIKDFRHAQADKIDLDNAVMAALGSKTGSLGTQFYSHAGATNGHDGNDHIVYNTTTGKLYYDSNGNGAGGITQIALIGTVTHPGLAVGDFAVV